MVHLLHVWVDGRYVRGSATFDLEISIANDSIVLSYAGLVLLGISNRILGSDGMVTAWMFYVCAVIFTSQLYGLVSKEWQGVDRRSIIMLLIGLVCAILSVVLAFVSCLV